jgi:hypothetical protein
MKSERQIISQQTGKDCPERVSRKKKIGFLITGNAEKRHFSQKFIRSSESLSSGEEDESINSDDNEEEGNLILVKKSSNAAKNN